MLRKLFAVLVASLVTGSLTASASSGPRRVPKNADYLSLLVDTDQKINACSLFLSNPSKDQVPIVIVRSRPAALPGKTIVEAASFGSRVLANPEAVAMTPTGLVRKEMPTGAVRGSHLVSDVVNPVIKEIMNSAIVANDSTIIVPKGNMVTGSLLIRQSGDSQFIVEQESEPARFARNLGLLRDRAMSHDIAFFDFSPRSAASLGSMGISGSLSMWESLSQRIRESITKYSSGTSSTQSSSYEALVRRLSQPGGAVVMIYAHSDGESLILDTEEGVRSISATDILAIGETNGGVLPPVMLLNCETRSVLAKAFLEAGSPLVMTSNAPLPVLEVERFVDRLSRRVFKNREDVIDAFFDVQKSVDLIGFCAIARASDEPALDSPAHPIWCQTKVDQIRE